jgi:hypothetical protein
MLQKCHIQSVIAVVKSVSPFEFRGRSATLTTVFMVFSCLLSREGWYTEWSKSHATHKSVTRENFTIMLVVILILYVGTTVSPPHSPQVLARPWLHPVHPQSSENVICDEMVFSRDQRVFILEHYFSTRSYTECQNALEILSQTL